MCCLLHRQHLHARCLLPSEVLGLQRCLSSGACMHARLLLLARLLVACMQGCCCWLCATDGVLTMTQDGKWFVPLYAELQGGMCLAVARCWCRASVHVGRCCMCHCVGTLAVLRAGMGSMFWVRVGGIVLVGLALCFCCRLSVAAGALLQSSVG